MSKQLVSQPKQNGLAESINELYGYTLTPEETNEAAANLRQFFEVLIQVDRSNEERKNADPKQHNIRNTNSTS